MDALARATFELTSRDDDMTAAYGAGYSDGMTLLHGDAHNAEPFQRTHARYLSYAGLDDPTAGERAYIDGFRDVASDNLFCPRRGFGSHARHIAA